MNDSIKRVLLVGGGSGGHVFPLLAVADYLKSIDSSIDLAMIGDGDFIKMAAQSRSINFTKIHSPKLRRYFSIQNVIDIWKIPVGLFQSLWSLYWFMPDVVFAKGGYSSFFPVLVAWLYRIPVYLHDSDSIPGSANIFLSKISKRVFIGFESARKYFKAEKVIFSGNPVREDIINGNRDDGINHFQLDFDRKTILIIGGSQGAKVINDHLLESAPLITREWQVIHQTGASQFKDIEAGLNKIIEEGANSYGDNVKQYYKILPFLVDKDLKMAYAAADLIVCRAGASLIFEAAQLGKPVVVIPLSKSAKGHQNQNAREFGRFGAVVIEEQNLTRNILINQIQELLSENEYQRVSSLIKQFATPDADKIIAEALVSELK